MTPGAVSRRLLLTSGLAGLASTRRTAAATGAPSPVLRWNAETVAAIRTTATDPFMASRMLALSSIAVFDTLRAIDRGPAFLVQSVAHAGLEPEAAIAGAAHQMLVSLFPARRVAADEALAAALAGTKPDHGPAVTFGRAVADSVMLRRDNDGWRNPETVPPPTAPGNWRPTEPSRLPALHPEWKNVTPFTLSAPSQFRPPAPPPLDSAAFREARDKVALLGVQDSKHRTADQTQAARFWNDPAGTDTPPGHWNSIARTLIAAAGLSLRGQAEVLAELNVALADAGVAVADAKYTYLLWRPITAIRAGDAQTKQIPDWLPLLETPNHPSYISGHSAFSGAAQTVLTARLGAFDFRAASSSLPDVTRWFADPRQAAEEAAASRLWGGIHYEFENLHGLATGCAVGAWTVAVFALLNGDHDPVLVMDGTAGGYAFASRQPVTSLTVAVGGDSPVPVAVDDRGHFMVPPAPRDQPPGMDMVLRATSRTGRVRTMKVAIAAR